MAKFISRWISLCHQGKKRQQKPDKNYVFSLELAKRELTFSFFLGYIDVSEQQPVTSRPSIVLRVSEGKGR